LLLERMVGRASVCLRRLAEGRRGSIVGFGRFLSNPRVSVDRLIEGWGQEAAAACVDRHVLAIQDLSEVNFGTRPDERRGLGRIGHGNAHGVLLHAMVAVDADDASLLGLVSGQVWTRGQAPRPPHRQREQAAGPRTGR
jgi:hypothetical protein